MPPTAVSEEASFLDSTIGLLPDTVVRGVIITVLVLTLVGVLLHLLSPERAVRRLRIAMWEAELQLALMVLLEGRDFTLEKPPKDLQVLSDELARLQQSASNEICETLTASLSLWGRIRTRMDGTALRADRYRRRLEDVRIRLEIAELQSRSSPKRLHKDMECSVESLGDPHAIRIHIGRKS
ncbi:hypothetical protein MKEN_00290400 [Mycena kentingensis (nom. inval.)]|nr:hypothetical protein MKEN_00290400 [Mycena kentingensis (nom. inval.)]